MNEQNLSDKQLIKLVEERLLVSSGFQEQIDELTDKLYNVNKKLKNAEAYKGHFISNITNEIINPFASILLLSENIQRLGDGEIKKAKKMAELIQQEAFHLDFQLQNIFAAAMIESGKEGVSVSSVNLKTFMQSIQHFFQKQIASKKLQLTVHYPTDKNSGCFVTDSIKLEMIVKNLLSNAIKFSHVGGKIILSMECDERNLNFSIRDFGTGIPEEEREDIFDRFKQVDERINSINTGHGLGLSIVKSYGQMLNGDVELSFPQDGGTYVQVKLPSCSEFPESDDLDDFVMDSGETF